MNQKYSIKLAFGC